MSLATHFYCWVRNNDHMNVLRIGEQSSDILGTGWPDISPEAPAGNILASELAGLGGFGTLGLPVTPVSTEESSVLQTQFGNHMFSDRPCSMTA